MSKASDERKAEHDKRVAEEEAERILIAAEEVGQLEDVLGPPEQEEPPAPKLTAEEIRLRYEEHLNRIGGR